MKVVFKLKGRDRSEPVSGIADLNVEVAIPFDGWMTAPGIDDLWDAFKRFADAFLGYQVDWADHLDAWLDEYDPYPETNPEDAE